jgi:hypothetical protein
MTKPNNDIAVLEEELAILDQKVAQETATPAEVIELARLRSEQNAAEGQAERWKERASVLSGEIDWAEKFKDEIPDLLSSRRVSLRRLEIAAGLDHTWSAAAMLEKFDRGSMALAQWSELHASRIKAAKPILSEYRQAQHDAEGRAQTLGYEVKKLEKEQERRRPKFPHEE